MGTFALATEIFDDSGAPHTLEHLVFMGSKTFPYSGLLDKMATRAYAYTNAYTAVDHTAYILETAGWEGFAQILPVYLEHVMLPRLTNEACMTEVQSRRRKRGRCRCRLRRDAGLTVYEQGADGPPGPEAALSRGRGLQIRDGRHDGCSPGSHSPKDQGIPQDHVPTAESRRRRCRRC